LCFVGLIDQASPKIIRKSEFENAWSAGEMPCENHKDAGIINIKCEG